jgi:hypothetical protein
MRGWTLVAAIVLAASAPAGMPAVRAQPGGEEAGGQSDADAFRAAVAEMRATMLRTGERVEGWDRGGVDPDAELRAMGAERHYFLNRGRDGAGVTILTARPLADFAPAAWRIVDSYGSAAERLEDPQLDFQPLSARYVLGVRANVRRQNDAACYRDFSHALLYELPGAPASQYDELLPIMFRMTILALEGQTICVRSEGDRVRGYTSRYFLPDGRALPELDDPTGVTTIVPAAPVERLIAPPPEPGAPVS